MRTDSYLTGFYDYRLVSLSILIAVLAAYATLDLAGRVTTARPSDRLVWLCGGATAMGIGIWTMHYIGMEAFHLPVPVVYDWPSILLSLFAAVLASGVALFTVSRPIVRLPGMIAGGVLMGAAIAAMHYIGMYSMRLHAAKVYSPGLVVLSILLAMVISFVALQQAFKLRDERTSGGWRKAWIAVLLGSALPVMHYVGMAAAHFVPSSLIEDHDTINVSGVSMLGIIVVTILILGFVFLSSTFDRRFDLEAQRYSENLVQLQAVFDNLAEAIVVVDSTQGVVHHNPAASKLLGVQEKSVSLQEIFDNFDAVSSTGELLSPDEWPIVRALHGSYCKNEEMIIREKADGNTLTVEISTAPVGVPRHDGRQVVVMLHDITERKVMDAMHTRLAAIVESSEDAIIGKDGKGVVTSWNEGAEKIFGYTAAEMVGQPILRLLPEDRLHEESDILQRIQQGETVDHIETVRKRKNGQFIQVSLTVSPIRDASGTIIGASKIARNITEKKHLENLLHQSQKMEAIGQLTGGVAHDFNNLLSVIVGNLGLIERRVSGDEVAIKRIQTARRAAARGADLTHRLLAFSRNVDLKPVPTKIHHGIRNVLELARTLGPDMKIVTHLDDTIPLVLVDPSGFESALLNLIVNARDAMPTSGTLTITTRLCNLEDDYPPVRANELRSGLYAYISVADTGHGMSKETLERVFEPFFTTKERGKGTGLGLAMVYGFVKQSCGTVRIYSEPGYGTTVSFYLPLSDSGPQPVPSAVAAAPPEMLSGKVLVVDDEPDVLEIAVIYLEEMGYTVYQAKDGTEALEIAERLRDLDLIVTDIIMPGPLNGTGLAQKVRHLIPQIKVIYCSGFAADALEERSMRLAEGPMLNKPYQREEFDAMIRAVMSGQ